MPSKDFLPGIGAAVDFGFDQLSGAINFKRQRRMLDHMNRYNAPKAQMQRLEEAGINPHAILGNTSGGGQSANLPSVSGAPNTSRYQDSRIKSAQTDLVQKQSDIAAQKLEQERIATEIQKTVHAYMTQKPDSMVEITGPGGTSFKTSPGELDRYQLGAQARHQIQLNDSEIREIEKMSKGATTMEQAIANLGVTGQKLKSLINQNRLWDSIDDLVKNSATPAETLSVIIKMLLSSIGAKTN